MRGACSSTTMSRSWRPLPNASFVRFNATRSEVTMFKLQAVLGDMFGSKSQVLDDTNTSGVHPQPRREWRGS